MPWAYLTLVNHITTKPDYCLQSRTMTLPQNGLLFSVALKYLLIDRDPFVYNRFLDGLCPDPYNCLLVTMTKQTGVGLYQC
jgi:hypothetical protein